MERIDNPADARSYLYKTTIDLLSHLGIGKVSELPEYEQVRKEIEAFKTETREAAGELTTS